MEGTWTLAARLPRACLFVAIVFSASTLMAQTTHDAGAWTALFSQGDLKCNEDCPLRWWFDGHARFFDDTDGFGQSIVRPGVGYELTDAMTVWAGYGWIRTVGPN